MLSKVYLKKEKYPRYFLGSDDNCMNNLGRINIFIGQNNCGKSRFLRSFFIDEDFEFDLKKADFNSIVNLINEKHSEVRNLLDSLRITEADKTFKTVDDVKAQISKLKIGKVKEDLKKVNELANYYISLKKYGGYSHHANIISGDSPDRIIPNINKIGNEISQKLNESFSDDFDYKFEKIYIPILKGLRPIQMDGSNEFKEQKDNYKARTLRDYFKIESHQKLTNEIFTGLNLYEDTKKLLLGNKEGRDRIKNFEEFLSENFFENQVITLIPDINNDVLLIGIGDEERPVYELGDGVQALIILLYPLFFNQDKNLLVFIEEPENSMHPGMQRLFLETLMKNEFKNFQYFITTHSNHFLDITLDLESISIYTFKKNKDEKSDQFSYYIENTSNDDIKILDLIGVRNASVFLSNCTIWVEGITDRLYLKKYLDIYQDYLLEQKIITTKLKEDFNYSFVEYGGGNIVHWSFTNELGWDKMQASKISSKIFVIADKDSSDEKPSSEKAKRLAQLKEKLGDRFRIVNGREIENTLSEKAIIETVKKIEGKNAQNVSYAEKKIKIEKYKTQKLGKFIETNFSNLKRKFEADSGTVYCKLEFCKNAVELMNNIDDLSEEGVSIAKNIFDFIKACNTNP